MDSDKHGWGCSMVLETLPKLAKDAKEFLACFCVVRFGMITSINHVAGVDDEDQPTNILYSVYPYRGSG